MFIIRSGVFETNSSSTHSLVVCTAEQYDKLESDTYDYLIDDGDEVVSFEEAVRQYNENPYITEKWDLMKADRAAAVAELEDREVAFSLNSWLRDWYEDYAYHFTTPSGDKMVAFGYYGFDG